MSVALLVITDGRRDCISRTIPSAAERLHGDIRWRFIYDDSGDPEHTRWLYDTFHRAGYIVFSHPDGRQGFGGAVRYAWASLLNMVPFDFVFHLEDDFTFNRHVNVDPMAQILNLRPHLVQLALRRQPWNDEERAAGGIVELHPDDWVDRQLGLDRWLESRRNFTTNPCLYRRSLMEGGWPDGPHSEGHFGIRLLEDPDLAFGFWGARESGEWVTHIGHERVGVGY